MSTKPHRANVVYDAIYILTRGSVDETNYKVAKFGENSSKGLRQFATLCTTLDKNVEF